MVDTGGVEIPVLQGAVAAEVSPQVVPVEKPAGFQLNFTPLAKEQRAELSGDWKPGLGGRFVGAAREDGAWLDSLSDKLDFNALGEKPADYSFLSTASTNERRLANPAKDLEDFNAKKLKWENDWRAYLGSLDAESLPLKLVGIQLKDGEKITEDQIEQALTKVKSYFNEDFSETKIDTLLNDLKETYRTPQEFQADFPRISQFCKSLFGDHAGLAVAHLAGGEIGLTDGETKKQMAESVNVCQESENGLLDKIKLLSEKPASAVKPVVAAEKAAAKAPSGDEVNPSEEKPAAAAETSTESQARFIKEGDADTKTTGFITDIGSGKRENNEDFIFISNERIGLFDGVGGQSEGDKASQLVASCLKQKKPLEDCLKDMPTAIASGTSASDASTVGTIAEFSPTEIKLAHAGDTRGYIISETNIRQITKDDTWVQGEVDAGRLTSEQARNHEKRNVITRDIRQGAKFSIENWNAGDVLLLCSDGLYDVVTDQEMVAVIAKHPDDFQKAAEELIALAKQKGASDNISVALRKNA